MVYSSLFSKGRTPTRKYQLWVGSPLFPFLLRFYPVRSARNIYKIVGNAVRAERKKARLSQETLAERADLTRNYIGQIERAEKKVTLEALAKVAKGLKIAIAELIRDA